MAIRLTHSRTSQLDSATIQLPRRNVGQTRWAEFAVPCDRAESKALLWPSLNREYPRAARDTGTRIQSYLWPRAATTSSSFDRS